MDVKVQNIDHVDGDRNYLVRVSIRSEANGGFYNDADIAVLYTQAGCSGLRTEARCAQAVYDFLQSILEARLVRSSRHN